MHNELLQFEDKNKAALLILFDQQHSALWIIRFCWTILSPALALQVVPSSDLYHLHGRKRTVHILDATSKESDLTFGMPQGSLL